MIRVRLRWVNSLTIHLSFLVIDNPALLLYAVLYQLPCGPFCEEWVASFLWPPFSIFIMPIN